MMKQLQQIIALLITLIIHATVGLTVADEGTNTHILNTDFGAHIGIVSDVNSDGQQGIFIYGTLDDAPMLSILREDIESAAFEHTDRYLVAYDASGQALYELPDNRYQMQITTPNGAVNMNYAAGGTDLQGASAMTETEDILLQQSTDGMYRVYLLSTGELSVIMGPDANRVNYQVTFTGVPALNVSLTMYSADTQ